MADVELEIRVRYHEVDRMGIVYHPRYLSWFEMARMELLRGLGLPYQELEDRGIGLPVLKVESRHHRPLRFDQWFRLECTLLERGKARFTLGYRILVGAELMAEGSTEHAPVRLPEGKATRLPPELSEALDRLPSQGGEQPVMRARDPRSAELSHP